MILLTKDTEFARVPVSGSALCVYHERYAPPVQFPRAIPWKLFEREFSRLVDSVDTLVLVGLNRIITPANRVKVGAMVLRPRRWIRISIDHTLFRSEPWRAWFHFGCVQAPYHGYSYSYLAESDWRGFVDGTRDVDPFSLERLLSASSDVVRTEYKRYFDAPEISILKTSSAEKAAYAEEKSAAFDEEHTLPAIVKRLTRFAEQCCPERSLPDVSRLFESTRQQWTVTDLGIDSFLVRRLQAMITTTNTIAERCYGQD